MKAKSLNEIIAEIIVLIGTNGMPSGEIYARMMADINLDTWNAILQHGKEKGIFNESMHFVTLTDNGIVMYNKLVEILTK